MKEIQVYEKKITGTQSWVGEKKNVHYADERSSS